MAASNNQNLAYYLLETSCLLLQILVETLVPVMRAVVRLSFFGCRTLDEKGLGLLPSPLKTCFRGS
jgi:hypothetical protein